MGAQKNSGTNPFPVAHNRKNCSRFKLRTNEMRKMKPYPNYFLAGLTFVVLFGLLSGRAATVWNGPLITYNQPAPDPTQAANRDQLTPNVSLTRADSSGMLNGV